ncbi:MAG: trichothecene 15-O-acetyltransferase [Cirrosporium novae-zelandiae]|nr:MAG: trichothecene 15-O-acetyltransferase [Cirrosporium novae-zelandiae]
MAGLPQIPPLNLDNYEWRPSPSDPLLYQRRSCGSEATVGLKEPNERGEYDLYFGCPVQFHQGVSTLGDLERHVKTTWKKFRFSHPEVTYTPGYDDQVTCLVQYRIPKNPEEVERWAEETVVVHTTDKNYTDLRQELEEKRKAAEVSEASKGFTIHIAAPVAKSDSLDGKDVLFIFHLNHITTDGMGIRVLVGQFFRDLALQLSGGGDFSIEGLQWADTVKNLPPAYLAVRKPDIDLNGPKYEQILYASVGVMMQLPASHSLVPKESGPSYSRSAFAPFTLEETKAVISAVKTKLGPTFTITHLAQSAVFIALLLFNPVPESAPEETSYISSSVMDGRRFLLEPHNEKTPFSTICQCSATIAYPAIKSYNITKFSSKKEINEALAKGSEIAKQGYDSWISMPESLTSSASVLEMVAMLLSTTPMGESTAKLAAPRFTSDGIDERFIQPTGEGKNSEKVFDIKDILFSVNQISAFPSVRLHSFRGSSRLSIDYNQGWFDDAYMQEYLDCIKQLMVGFADMELRN